MGKQQDAAPRRQLKGLEAALARGQEALAAWIDEGVVLPPAAFAASRGVSVQALSAAVRRGDLFAINLAGRRYYVATLLPVKPQAAAAVCQALAGLSDLEKAFFWLRPHGALGARTVAETVAAGEPERVVALANASAAQARAARLIDQRKKTKSILDMAGMLQAPEGVHVSIEDMNLWR